MSAFYNENDPKAAAWLRELMTDGQIPDGTVDERDIRDVRPDDLSTYRQVHLFAGIAGWGAALRRAGWDDDREIWTISCPCPSFSTAGRGAGFVDERHLWPAAFWLIEQRKPPVIMGEQVAAAIAHGWLDLVQDDLEGIGYACRAIVLPAASVGAPHIRERLWFVAELADAERGGARRHAGTGAHAAVEPERLGAAQWLGSPSQSRLEVERSEPGAPRQASLGDEREAAERAGAPVDRLGDPESRDREVSIQQRGSQSASPEPGRPSGSSFWSDCEWISCRDGKARPTQPGLQCLVTRLPGGMVPSGDPSESDARHTSEARVMRLRGYGNSINIELASEVIRAYMETT